MKTLEEIARSHAGDVMSKLIERRRIKAVGTSTVLIRQAILAAMREGAEQLVEALKSWHCPECGGRGYYRVGRGESVPMTPAGSCPQCNGSKLHATARQALAAFEETP